MSQTKRDFVYHEKKRLRELYNKELFTPSKALSVPHEKNQKTKEYNPFYDNSYLHNISSLTTGKQGASPPSENVVKETRVLKDEMVQTDTDFYIKEDFPKEKEKKDENKNPKSYKTYFLESHDHEILHKIKEDYRDFVRQEGGKGKNVKSDVFRYNLHKSVVDPVNTVNPPQHTGKVALSQDPPISNKIQSQKAYADELLNMITQKQQNKMLEKQRSDLLSQKLLRESLENSPFGRAGGGAPNRDPYGNLLIRKGMFVNDNQSWFNGGNNGSRSAIYKGEVWRSEDINAKSFERSLEEPEKEVVVLKNESDFVEPVVKPNLETYNNFQTSPQKQVISRPPVVPKVLDMKEIEKEFLLNTEYKKAYDPSKKGVIDVGGIKEMGLFAFQEHDRQVQMKKYQEQLLLQKILYEQIEEKRKKKEYEKMKELERQQIEEERLKKQREEIIEKHRRDLERKHQELAQIKESIGNASPQLKPIEKPTLPSDSLQKQESPSLALELKLKEEEKILEIARQKALYEQKLEDVNSHLVVLRNQLFSQQNMLNEELNKLKAESLMANEQRYRAQKELEELREDLKKQELMEDIRRNELHRALVKNRGAASDVGVIYPHFAKDFHKAFQYHQLNNSYQNDSLDTLVQRTSFLPLTDFNKNPQHSSNKPSNHYHNNDYDFDYSNSLTQATKVQSLPLSLSRLGGNNGDLNALDILRTNEERLSELKHLDKTDGIDMQSRLDGLISEINK